MAAIEEPGGVRGESTRWQVGEGAGVQAGVDLLDDGMIAVLGLGLDQLERGISKNGVIPPRGEQLVLPPGLPSRSSRGRGGRSASR
jgi:hypothetical protein